MTFLGDEGRDVLAVKRMIVDHDPTFIGPTASVGGFFLGPIYYYFMIPFLWLFSLNPVGPAVMVGLTGVATVFLVYLVGKKIFDEKTGLVAALLYSLSPVVINYSHSSWNPNVVPFFSLLLVYFLLNLHEKKRGKDFFALGMMLGIGLQLHYLFSFLFLFVFLHLFWMRKKISRYHVLIFLSGIILPLIPFLLFEVAHNFLNTKLLLSFIFTSSDTGFSGGNFFKIVFDIAGRLFVRLVVNNLHILGLFLAIFSVAALFLKRQFLSKSFLAVFLTWLLVPLFLFGFYKKEIYDYYLGIVFAVPFLLSGFLLTAFWKNKILLVASFAVLFFLIKINWDARPFVYVPNRQLNQTRTISEFVLEKASGKPFNFALVTGQNSDHAYRYFFEIKNNPAVVVQNKEVDPERKSVTEQILVVCEITCEPLGNSLWEIAGFGRAEIVGEWNVSVVKVYKLVHYQGN